MASISYSLSIKSAEGISWRSKYANKKPKLYVEVLIDQKKVWETRVIERGLPATWNENLVLPSATEASILIIRVKHKTLPPLNDPCIGTVNKSVSALLHLCEANTDVKIELESNEKKANSGAIGVIFVCIEAITREQVAQMVIENARDDLQRSQIDHGPDPSRVDEILGAVDSMAAVQQSNLVQSLEIILGKIKIIADVTVNVMDEVSKVHPYANAAWQILSSLYKAYKVQCETDAAVVALFAQMVALYSFVDDIEPLPNKIKRLESIIVNILEQTTECAIFVREYTNHGFGRRLAGQALSNAAQKIQNLSQALSGLQAAVTVGVTVQTAFVSAQIWEGVERLVQSDILKDLEPVVMDASSRPECLPGTREAILKIIMDWLTSPSAEINVLWLHGVAGSGKSTIAATIAEYFRRLRRRGAFLFFDRNSPARSGPAGVLRTVAYQLAASNATLQASICNAIKQNSLIATAPLDAQFTKLILEPLCSCQLETAGPIVIILDAFDECGDAESRNTLITLLSNRLAEVPHQFRFLITSRREPDIARAFEAQTHIESVALDDSDLASNTDVLSYIKHEMRVLYRSRRHSDELPADWPGETAMHQLAAYAAGLFIWASTAMKFLRTADDPVERLGRLLDRGPLRAFTLGDLYATALRSASSWEQGAASTANNHRVLGAIVVGRVPLTDRAMDHILGFEGGQSCRIVLRRLGCLLRWDEGLPIRTLHASFADYLMDSQSCRGEPWFVDKAEHHSMLTVGCLKVLNTSLRFNICRLETSHVCNDDVPNISQRVGDAIPEHLAYSCCYWADHLERTPYGSHILESVTELMHLRLLYWLETLSLIKKVHVVSSMLSIIRQWCKNGDPAKDFAADSMKFVAAFAGVISHSAPHIYVSAVPFSPQTSKVRQQYLPILPYTLSVRSGLDERWPPCQQILEGHSSFVSSVAFSPDGKLVASGSNDNSIRVWAAETGILVSGPFKGHTKDVRSVAFSPNSKQVASGSDDKAVRIWDAQTGVLLFGPFKSHMDGVNSVAFSPDGKHIVSGSGDKTIRIWDPDTGVLICKPLEGHTNGVRSVAFSPDGTHVASGSDDNTIRLWDAQTGTLVYGPFDGHTDRVYSVAFSPDGKYVASGSADKTIRIWGAQTGALTSGLFEGHTNRIRSVAFSANGKHVASASQDHTIRIWDVQKGLLASGPFEGHTSWVQSVAFSPDGKHVASASDDKTIRIWDAEAGVLTSGSFKGHTYTVTSVAFSPDGKHVASGSYDNTIRVWDAETGVLVSGPFGGYAGCVHSVAFSPDGMHIASGSDDCTIRIWDAETGTLFSGPFKGHTNWVYSVAFSPDSKRVASGSRDNAIRIWDAETGILASAPFEGHTGSVQSVAFSPDGKHLASGSDDSTIRIWAAETGTLIYGPFDGHTGYVYSVVFSPDGKQVASGSCDKTIRLWDAQTGTLISGPFEGHTDYVNSVAFSPNGKHIASASNDKTVRIWDAQTSILVSGPFEGHTDSVSSVVFAPDGKHIVSGSRDKTIRIFATDPESLSNPEISSSSDPPNIYSLPPSTVDSNIRLCKDSKIENGWKMDSPDTLLFWLPPSYRDRLWLWDLHNTGAIGAQCIRLDLSRFVHGSDWQRCHIAGDST